MKKLLLIIVIVLLLVLGCITTIKGIQIGGFKIASFKEISENNKNLDLKIQQLNSEIDVNYPSKQEDLNKTSKNMQSVRGKYLDELTYSSNEDLENSLKIKNYDIERLWARVGNHAIDAGVNISLELKSGSSKETRDLNFTVIGTYLAQTNFLYALEDDEELSFRIYEYKLVPNDTQITSNDQSSNKDNKTSSINLLKGTFLIKDIRITDSLNESLSNSTSSGQQNTSENTEATSDNSEKTKTEFDNLNKQPENTQTQGTNQNTNSENQSSGNTNNKQ